MKKKCVVLTGAGISADSGLLTFRDADVVIIVGTSMQVYPAASLIHYAPPDADCYLVDPNPQGVGAGVEVIAERAASGVPKLAEYLIGRAGGQS